MKKVIITGPTGCIGVALAQRLAAKGNTVYAVCRPNSKNIAYLKKIENLNIIECDLSSLRDLKKEFGGGFDEFYHLGWAGTFGSDRDNSELQLLNIKYTLDAVNAAKDLGCKVFVGAGSQAEYGIFNKPADENTKTNPITHYGAAKLSAGHMSRIEANRLGLRHIWLRVFSVYGPYDEPNTLIYYVINSLLKALKPMLTKGEQIWDYLYSGDAAEAFERAAELGKNNGIYCLGSGINKPLREYIMQIQKAVCPDMALGLGEKEYAGNQIMNLAADISKLRIETGFEPRTSFDEGILKTLDYIKQFGGGAQ